MAAYKFRGDLRARFKFKDQPQDIHSYFAADFNQLGAGALCAAGLAPEGLLD